MRDFNIGTRLAIGFAVMIALATAFGAFAYVQASRISQAANQLEKVSLPLNYFSEDIRSSVQKQYSLFHQRLTTIDPVEVDRLDASLILERTRTSDLLSKFDAVPLSDKQQAALSQVKSSRTAYSALLDAALDLNKLGTEAATSQAFGIDSKNLRPAYLKFLESSEALVAASRSSLQDQPQSITDATSGSTNGILLCVICAVVLSMIAAVLITRSITAPISEAVGVLDQVSQGDLTCRVPINTKDELGLLFGRLNQQLDSQWAAAGVAERLAENDTTVHVSSISDRDVLGRSFLRMRNNLLTSVDTIDKIANGEVTIQPRVMSDKDSLGNALNRLRDTVRTSAETAKRLAEGDLQAEIHPVSASDLMRYSLLRIRQNLQSSTELATRLSNGDLAPEIGAHSNDGTLSHALLSLREKLIASVQMAERIAEGDLTMDPSLVSKHDSVGNAFAKMLTSLRRFVGNVVTSAHSVTGVSSEIIAASELIVRTSSEHSAATAQTTSFIDGIASSLKQTAESSEKFNKLAFAAAQDGRLSGEAMSQTVDAMKEVAARISMLDEVSRRTDMLTLAAAVEAARAGEHGLGFGVLASELRKLGERSQSAASEIVRLGNGGVKAAESAGEILTKLLPGINQTAQLLREVASSSTEQTLRANQANQAFQQLDQVIHQNVAASQQIAAAAEQLTYEANALQSTISFFKLAEALGTPVIQEQPVLHKIAASVSA